MEFRWEMSKDSGKDTGVGLTCDAGPSAPTTHSSQQKAGQRDPLALSLHGPGCVLFKANTVQATLFLPFPLQTALRGMLVGLPGTKLNSYNSSVGQRKVSTSKADTHTHTRCLLSNKKATPGAPHEYSSRHMGISGTHDKGVFGPGFFLPLFYILGENHFYHVLPILHELYIYVYMKRSS